MPFKSLSHVGLLVVTMSTLASSQTSTITLFLPLADTSNEGDLVGSIITSDDTATTYAIGCASGVIGSICNDFPGTVTVTEASDMAAYTITPFADDTTTIDYALTVSCSLDPSSASCTYDYSDSETSTFDSEIYSDDDYTGNPVLITPNTAAASTTAAASSTTGEASTTPKTSTKGKASTTAATSSASHASGATASPTSGSSSTTRGTSTSTGIGAAITAAQAWVFGVAAFAFAAVV